ncbi:MAG TPA: hypothetical protein VMI73_07450 [Trebonia sp.]|nr:hypothetical protein [Trebonia sp.]
MRRNWKFRAPGIAGALLAAIGGVVLAGSGTSARADTVISLPASVTYLNQTLPDTLGGNGYVFIAANGEIIVCNVAGQQVTSIDAGDGIGALALSADGATLYASVGSGANAGSVAAITVSSIASGPPQQTFYPLAAGDQPGSIAVQSGKVWVSYSTTVDAVTTTQIGAINLANNGTFEPAAVPGTWDKSVDLAADPQDTGVLAAVSFDSPAEAATYDTTTDPATPLAAQGDLGTGGNACTYLGEVAVVPGGQRFAAGCDGPASVQEYSTADIATGVAAYNANGGGTSQAIAVAVDTDGTFAVANRTSVYVYKADGTLLNSFAITAGNKTDEAYGLEWVDTAGGSGLAAVSQSVATKAYMVQIFSKAKLLRPTVKLSATAKTSFGKPVKLTGTSLLPGGGADTAKVTITRSGPGGTVSLPAVTPSSAGAFTATDTPTAVGSYTYTATSGATSATAKATVVKDTPALTLIPASCTVGYKSVVHLTATLGATHGNRTVTIYAQVNGGKKKVIATGKVNSKGQLSVAWTALQSSTFSVTFAGDADDAAVTASATASVRAQVTQTLSGQYGTKKSGGTTYRLYHRTGKVTVAATVTPGHPGECVKAELQVFANGTWHASTTTACTKLSAASKATVSLALSKAQLGVPYRVRANYVSGSKTNASGNSAWQYVMAEK